jgi:hypothetical protein
MFIQCVVHPLRLTAVPTPGVVPARAAALQLPAPVCF